MEQRERRYISYLLRLWQTRDGTRSVWRASLEDPHSGECRGFADLEQLCAFLKQQIIADGGSGGWPAEQKGKEGDAWDRGQLLGKVCGDLGSNLKQQEVCDMKTRKSVLLSISVALIMALLAIPGPAVAQATKTEFVGTSTVIKEIDPGVLTFPGGNVHIRGMVIEFQEKASDPRASGTNTGVINANWDSDWTGPMWGTFHIVVNAYGTWEGTYTGAMGADGSSIRGVAHGTGGLEGLIYSVNCDYTLDPAVCSGQILSPHGQ